MTPLTLTALASHFLEPQLATGTLKPTLSTFKGLPMGADVDQRPGRRKNSSPDTAEGTAHLTTGRMPAARAFGIQGGHQA
jgi:hypothetical protein